MPSNQRLRATSMALAVGWCCVCSIAARPVSYTGCATRTLGVLQKMPNPYNTHVAQDMFKEGKLPGDDSFWRFNKIYDYGAENSVRANPKPEFYIVRNQPPNKAGRMRRVAQ